MRYKEGHKLEAKARILAGVGRGFRKHGYGGIGVDGLAKEAGVTSGAFYSHFFSKGEAFKHAVSSGMAELREGILAFQAERGQDWLAAFIDFYLGPRRTCDLAEGCALQALTGEVARNDVALRAVYEAELDRVVEAMAAGMPGADLPARTAKARALLALLSGGVGMARAVASDELSAAIAANLRQAALRIAA